MASSLPAALDWCDQGGCTPIKDQRQCGSCWAFATAGVVESSIVIHDGITRDLAEQYLVSCNTQAWGCDGGSAAFDYFVRRAPPLEPGAGAVYEPDFPYVAVDAPCNSPYSHHEKLASWAYVAGQLYPSVGAIKQAIYDHGPVWVTVCVGIGLPALSQRRLPDGGIILMPAVLRQPRRGPGGLGRQPGHERGLAAEELLGDGLGGGRNDAHRLRGLERGTLRSVRRLPLRQRDPLPHPHVPADEHADAHIHPHTDSHGDPNVHSHADPHAVGHPGADAHPHSIGRRHADAHADRVAGQYTDLHAPDAAPHSDPDRHADADGVPHRLADIGSQSDVDEHPHAHPQPARAQRFVAADAQGMTSLASEPPDTQGTLKRARPSSP